MNNTNELKSKMFLYRDERVKYGVLKDGDDVTIECGHPLFQNRFKSNSATITLKQFYATVHKGSSDYEFFEKMKASAQEYFLDRGL